MATRRIGLTQRVEVVKSYGERRDCLDQAWTRLLETVDLLPIPLPNTCGDVVPLVRDLSLDGLILTGGNDLCVLVDAENAAPERDETERRLLDHASRSGLPVLGVCRGLQMMVVWAGGRLDRVEGHVATRHGVSASGTGAIPWMNREEVNSFHGWGIRQEGLGRDQEPLAVSPDGWIEAVRHNRLPHLGIMWHPEREPRDERDRDLIRNHFLEKAK